MQPIIIGIFVVSSEKTGYQTHIMIMVVPSVSNSKYRNQNKNIVKSKKNQNTSVVRRNMDGVWPSCVFEKCSKQTHKHTQTHTHTHTHTCCVTQTMTNHNQSRLLCFIPWGYGDRPPVTFCNVCSTTTHFSALMLMMKWTMIGESRCCTRDLWLDLQYDEKRSSKVWPEYFPPGITRKNFSTYGQEGLLHAPAFF